MELERKKPKAKKKAARVREDDDEAEVAFEDSVPEAPILSDLLEALNGDSSATYQDSKEEDAENRENGEESAPPSENLMTSGNCGGLDLENTGDSGDTVVSVKPDEELPKVLENESGANLPAANDIEVTEVGVPATPLHLEGTFAHSEVSTASPLYPQEDLVRELKVFDEQTRTPDGYCEVGREVIPSAPETSHEEYVSQEFVRPVEVEPAWVAVSNFEIQCGQLQQPRERPVTSTNIKLLYSNYLLENNDEFVKRFVELAQASLDGFELYELLMNNMRAYTKLTGCEKSLASLKDTCDDLEKAIWTLSTQTLSEKSYCEDNSTVTATYKIHTAEFNQQIFAQLRRTLKEIKELLQDSFSLHTYSVQLSKTQIEHFFYKSFGPLDMQNLHLNQNSLLNYRGLLQKCLTTLFTFIRKPLLHLAFVADCQAWIEHCASLLLRVATIEDHLFLLNHVLRCPPKIISKWGANLIQVPPIEIPTDPSVYSNTNSFGHLHLDFALTMLQTMLTTVPKREEFLMQRQLSNKLAVSPADTSLQWVVVDSDGEDEPEDTTTFKESDLIALLQQVPFESIFKRILLTYQVTGEDVHDIRFCSEHLLMKLIAFGVHLVHILSQGFATYYTDRYRQLVKLIGRLILHTVQYLTDQIQSFIEAHSPSHQFLSSLAMEYDAFMFGAVESLYNARNVGTLQFLAAIPYQIVSENMLWEMYRLLTKWDIFEENILRNENIVQDFEHELLAISESNAVYMLTTLSTMAMSQKEESSTFIRIVTLHLFQIGFLSPVTKDICSKHVRDLLGNLTRKYPLMISALIHKVKANIVILDKMSLFLLKELAFDLWKPLESDISLLSHWLLNFQPTSLENQIGRFIIQSMNWDFSEENELFLPYHLHFQVAILVVKAHVKWEHNQGRITEGVKQLSSWISRNPDLNTWAWDVIRRLHLHAFDRFCISNSSSFPEMTRDLPTLESTRELEPLRRAVEEKSPIGSAVALLMTPIGHSMPLLCDKGFELLDTLVQFSKFDSVVNVIYFTIPIFAESPATLADTEKFLTIMKSIASADASYIRMAKNLVVSDTIGPVSKLFGEMISAQLDQFPRFGVTEVELVELWIDVLTKLENWNKDTNVLYWLDILARFAYPRLEVRNRVHEKFAQLYKELPASPGSGLSSFFGWSSQATTLLPSPSYPQFGYLIYFVFIIETELETSTGFWKSLIGSLNNPKTSLETAIKRASTSSKFASSLNYISIYRWAQQALDVPLDCPLQLVFWQKFFLRYFQRITTSDMSRDGVGERFFEGMVNSAFLKKLKKRLHELLEFYASEIQKLEQTSNDCAGENVALLLENQKHYLGLVSAMALWIEDPKFHKDSLYVTALPPQCQPHKLSTLIEGVFEDWSDVVDAEAIFSSERESCKEFFTFLNRLRWIGTRRMSRYTPWHNSFFNRHDEFVKRLSSYDKPMEAPELTQFKKVLPELNSLMLMDVQTMRRELKPHFNSLNAFAKLFKMQISQHGSLDCSYCDQLPELYTAVESEALVNARCAGGKKGIGCSGPAHVVFQFTEARLNERVGHIIHQNRTEYHELIQSKGVQPPPLSICAAAVFVEDFITNLVLAHRKLAQDNKDFQVVMEVGGALFYLIVDQINEDTNFYPPTRQLYSSFLEIIGFEFIGGQPTEARQLVTTCIQNSGATGLLAPHINLANCGSTTLIEIYKEIIGIPKSEGDLAFVLLTKLDLSSWLVKARPSATVTERSQLISLIWKALQIDENPEQGNQMVRDTFRNHLKIVLLFDFPQHFGEILNYLLEDTDNQTCDIDLWYDFFNALSKDSIIFRRGMEPFAKKREMKRFATETDLLRYAEVMEVAKLLSNHFTSARLSHGIYGLYPKYKTYIEPLSCFHQMIAHLITAASLKNSQGLLSHKVIEIVWPAIRDLYAPWILPYDEKTIKQKCAQWIQNMNFESGSVLQPFVRNDVVSAMTMMSDFTDSVLFLAETVPGSSALFSNLWNFYVDNFAQLTAKDYVLNVVHNCLISIPWAIFWPSFTDLESMNKVVMQYLPSCHSFLGVVYAQINWLDWISNFIGQNMANYGALSKCHFYLLNITVNLANDIVARESPTWVNVMETVQHLNWQFVSSNSLEQILNFYVMSIDPRVVLALDSTHHMDRASFTLLKVASGYSNANCLDITRPRAGSPPLNKPDLNKKRYLFIRSFTRLLVSVSSKYKAMVSSNAKDFERALQGMIGDLALIIQKENQRPEEFTLHLKEIMNLMTNHYLATITRNAFISWCENNRNSPCSIYAGIIQLSFSTKVPSFITAPLIEIAIELSFKSEGTTWKNICDLSSVTHNQGEWANYTDVASKDGHYLVLNCLLLQKFQQLCSGGLSTLTTLTDLLKNIKPREENEAKLSLIYKCFMNITLSLLSEMEKLPGNSLEKGIKKFLTHFTQHLSSLADDKQGWGILGALGLSKSPQISYRGRFLARSLQTFLQVQIPINSPMRVLPEAPGHFNTPDCLNSSNPTIRPNAEIVPNLEKLESMKLDRQFSDLVEIIDAIIAIIKDPKFALSNCGAFINEITSRVFTERYLVSDDSA